VIAIEKDSRCVEALRALVDIAEGRLVVQEADATAIDPIALCPIPRMVVANLPYNVGTLLLLQWLEAIAQEGCGVFTQLTLMFQKEVAERITAIPGGRDYGRLSVLTQWLCETHALFDIPPGAFRPPPKVTSTVIALIPREKPLAPARKEALEAVLAAGFGQRRKMLRSSLKSLGCDVEQLLAASAIEPTLRAERVDVTGWCRLAQCYDRLPRTQ